MRRLDFIEIPGIHIQAPWSELILSGKKRIETRSYPLPSKFQGVPLAIIETPGPKKLVPKARITGVVVFSHSMKYSSKEDWAKDFDLHLVKPDNIQFQFKPGKAKYGWVVKSATRLSRSVPPPKIRGIIFASKCEIPNPIQ